MDIIDILAGDNFIIFNKEFAKKHGIEPAVLLGAMCGYQKGFRNEYFYREQDKILDDTGLTAYSLRNSVKVLQGLGIIEYEKRGMPAKYYYKVNAEGLERVLDFRKSRVDENVRSRDFEMINSCVCENDSTYNNNYKNENKNNNKKEKEVHSFDNIINNYTENEILRNALIEFIKMRKANRKPVTSHGLELLLTGKGGLFNLTGGDDGLAIDIVNQSIKNSWLGFFPLKTQKVEQRKESVLEMIARL